MGFGLSLLIWLDALSFPLFLQKDQWFSWGIFTGTLILLPALYGIVTQKKMKKNLNELELSQMDMLLEEKERIVSEYEPPTKDLGSPDIKPEIFANPMDGLSEFDTEVNDDGNIVAEARIDQVIVEEESVDEDIIAEVSVDVNTIAAASIDKVIVGEESNDEDFAAEESFNEDIMGETSIDENIVSEFFIDEVAITTDSIDITVTDKPNVSFEELLDKGFSAKELGNYEEAADYFLSALKTQPSPDLSFYLILDCYWLWKSSQQVEQGIKKLEPFIMDLRSETSEIWRNRLESWLGENHIQL